MAGFSGTLGGFIGRRRRGTPFPKMPVGGAVGGYGSSPKVGGVGGRGGVISPIGGGAIGGFARGKKMKRRKRG